MDFHFIEFKLNRRLMQRLLLFFFLFNWLPIFFERLRITAFRFPLSFKIGFRCGNHIQALYLEFRIYEQVLQIDHLRPLA